MDRLLWLQLIGIAAFNKVDYLMTLEALERGYKEANPLLASMVGTFQFPLVKLLLVPLLLIFMWQMRHRIGKSLVTLTWVPFTAYSMVVLYHRSILF
ncbi:hypothetical protein SAMN03080599_03090 [Acidaminobacter hydrogenoformans DSM 2784]|uniref:DUF5658 domain-containing protein n=2 Tax=Acidaminobacter TaxID=65402 RepID=A0A1G5S672_9FIRM|nr:hypothetical protein SAMN03080599_03090 [Acidaminobacter hydrogenoformans DSM 2784]